VTVRGEGRRKEKKEEERRREGIGRGGKRRE
jgi:hypothetical protein